MNELELMIDFYRRLPRQGPGSSEQTLKALQITGLANSGYVEIADIGCGTGAQTFTLADQVKGRITAVDLFHEFLEELSIRADRHGLQDRITTRCESMDKLSFDPRTFDLIWSEGAIYIMGFEAGVRSWRPFISRDGFLVVSEISWFTKRRPQELEDYWQLEYQEIDTIENKELILRRNGYTKIVSFRIPEYCWFENYYDPIRAGIPEFLDRHGNSKHAIRLTKELEREMEIYEKFKYYYGYAFYIAQKSKK